MPMPKSIKITKDAQGNYKVILDGKARKRTRKAKLPIYKPDGTMYFCHVVDNKLI